MNDEELIQVILSDPTLTVEEAVREADALKAAISSGCTSGPRDTRRPAADAGRTGRASYRRSSLAVAV